jgi:hypothetical protein
MSKPQAFLKAYSALFSYVLYSCSFTNLAVSDFIQDDGYITFHYATTWPIRTLYYNAGDMARMVIPIRATFSSLRFAQFVSLKQISFESLSRIIASLSG